MHTMAWSLINSAKHWEHGPKQMAHLRRQEDAARAMGNQSGANILRAQRDALQGHWDALYAKHAPEYLPPTTASPELSKLDTQGR